MPRISEELRSWADGGSPQALQRSLHTLKGSARIVRRQPGGGLHQRAFGARHDDHVHAILHQRLPGRS